MTAVVEETVQEGVRVCCRVRPLGYGDGSDPQRKVFVADDDCKVHIEHGASTMSFGFDQCFGEEATNAEVYHSLGAPLVASAMDGVHGSILCYGQTGGGKTYTMMGSDGIYSKGEDAGIVPRMFDDIFSEIESSDRMSFSYQVRLSIIEIYQDELYDLIPPSADTNTNANAGSDCCDGSKSSQQERKGTRERNGKIQIFDNGGSSGLSLVGAASVEVLNKAAALQIVDLAQQRRRVAETNMNRQSSRGHCVVLVTIVKRNLSASTSKIGQLYAVDLAGSESVGKTNARQEQIVEAGSINKSLLVLGRVIDVLTTNDEKGTAARVPYRDSKLTRLIQNSLGGSARCALCLNISPSNFNAIESLSTLRFGARTSQIKNCPVRNEVQSIEQLKVQLQNYKGKVGQNMAEISNMEAELASYAIFFRLIRRSGLVIDAALEEASLLSCERVDIRRPIQMGV
eukprot:g1910.t1